MIIEKDFQKTIEDSFLEYASYVAVDRALPDARDMLKVGARQILYSQYKDKITCDKPFKKAQKTVAAAMSLAYVHGDASAYGTAIRMGKPFVFRYPLEDIQGAYGNPAAADNHSASRYVEMRSSKLASELTKDLAKDTISQWIDNYDDTEKIPSVFPSKGFYNIVNGVSGIGVTLATSIPQFNLNEVNNAMIKLLQNPEIDFNEIYCAPDYASGGIIVNGNEVKESLQNGKGKSAIVRAKIEYNKTKNMLQVLEIPFGIFTNTICAQIGQLIEEEPNCGIDRLIDATKETPDIRIYLNKKANYTDVIKLLYQKTSLQYHNGINMMMLENGQVPRLYNWREALQAHINHEKIVYRKGFEYDLAKIEHRIHIIDGLLICIANLDEVIKLIKNSESPSAASVALQQNYLLDEEQTKAVLAIKLASLAKLEVEKLQNEKINLTQEANRIKIILENEKEFNQQLINGWEEISKKFGDKRRTKVYDNLVNDEKPQKVIRDITILINLYNDYIVKEGKSNLKSFNRGKVKFVMNGTTADHFYIFTNFGKCHCINFEKFQDNKGKINDVINLEEKEEIIGSYNPICGESNIYIATKLGMIKRMDINEITNIKKSKTYIILQDYDEVIGVIFNDGNKNIALASQEGNIVIFDGSIITSTKTSSRGVVGMKLKELTDEVVSIASVSPYDKYICTVTSAGFVKRTSIEEYPTTTRGTKGRLACKLNEDKLIEIKTITGNEENCNFYTIGEVPVKDIPEAARTSRGVDMLKM